MAVIGTATLNVVPKFPGLASAVRSELGKVDARTPGAKAGSDYGSAMGGGLAKSGAVIGTFSAVTAKAMDAIASHVGSAVSRFDTLNNYPKVMQQLGYSAKDSEASIAMMSDRLSTLPTTLDAMTTTVSGLVAITHDLPKATDAGLALNDMLIASGSNQQLVNAAMEQFRQILSKGKPEMEDWRSLVTAAPGQMDQLAKSMLGPTAGANDLYAALGGGKNDPTLTMDELIDAIIRLDSEGGEGFASFREQAESAAGGVQTASANMGNAITKGIAGTMEAIGRENIAGAFDDAKSGINEMFSAVNGGVSKAMPQVDRLYDHVKKIGPQAVTVAAGFAVFNSVGGVMANVASNAKAATEETTMLGQVSRMLGPKVTPASVAIGGLSAVLAVAAYGYMDAKKKSDNFAKATTGLSDAVKKAASLDEYAGKISGVGEKAKSTAMSVDEMTESVAGHVAKIEEANEKAEAQIGQLNAAQSIIDQYAGATDLSADAQGRLEWALKLVNEQFGLSITAADVAAGSYTDAEENVVNLKDSIYDLVEAKKQEVQMLALSDQLTEVYAARSEAAATLASAEKRLSDQRETSVSLMMEQEGASRKVAEAAFDENVGWQPLRDNVSRAAEAYRTASDAASQIEENLGDSAKAASDAADVFDEWGSRMSDHFKSVMDESGTSLANLKEDLRALGADTETLTKLSEPELIDLARAYDGTATSIVGKLRDMGVGMDEASAAAAEMASDIADSINGMDGVGDALAGVEVNVSDFAQKLAEAGVSTEQLNAIGSEQLSNLARNCGGDMDSMVWYVRHYNDTPLLDKDGNVQVDQAELRDAQGNLYTWNGSYLVDQNGKALVDDAELITGQGEIVTWNASSLKFQPGRASITSNTREQLGLRDDWNNGGFVDKIANASINIFRNVTDFITGGNASGGIRLNAQGGYRFHGAGAIATRAVPLDIVGEDGAEAIVPLTNKHYSEPFARTLAEQMGAFGGGGLTKADVYDAVSAALASADISSPAVYIDGREMTNALAPRMGARLGQIERRRSSGL